ncbi:MAG: hypothetical protein FWE94_05205 [Coriobacteriia bacterium]|nr:hypothetical protein [Coriobacteriia bacterium]
MSDKGPKENDPRWVSQVTDELVADIKSRAVNGKITCPVLRKIAEEHGLANRVAGVAADVAGVKVHSCDLGCF